MECGRDAEDVVVGAVVEGGGEGGVGADEEVVGVGKGDALDVVLVAESSVEDGRVKDLRDFL